MERLLDSSIAVIFQGQGHQYPGMGKETYDAYPAARRVYEKASEAIDMNVARLCFEGSKEELRKSANAQPAIFAMELADYRVYVDRYGQPGHAAGNSLGDYIAAVASGAISLADGIRIVRYRGQMLDEEDAEKPGAMAAVKGVSREMLASLRDRYGVEVANDNSIDQKVIAGLKVGVEAAREQIRAWGGKFKLLDIDAASHCSLRTSVAERLKVMLDNIEIDWPPSIPFVSNTDGEYPLTADQVRVNLSKQVAQTVEWVKTLANIKGHGAEVFIEIGPKKVLSPLIVRDHPEVEAKHFSELDLVA